MSRNLIAAIIIGTILGLGVGLSQIPTSQMGLIISILLCPIWGLITVLTIKEKPHLYSLVTILVTGLFLCYFYGFEQGAIYLLGVAILYGVISIQFFQAVAISFDNFNFLLERLFKKK